MNKSIQSRDAALWYTVLLHRCLKQTEDVGLAMKAAEAAFSLQPNGPTEFIANDENHHYIELCSCGEIISQCRCTGKDKKQIITADGCYNCKQKRSVALSSEQISIAFSFDIFNRRAQGILNRAIEATRTMNSAARIDLEKALKTSDPQQISEALIKFIDRYRAKLADLLTTTQLAALLEGAREVAKKIPVAPAFPGAQMIPATIEPHEAMELLETLRALPVQEREERIYELPGDQQAFVRHGLMAEQYGAVEPPGPFEPRQIGEGPDKIHFPIIDEAARELASKNVMTRAQFDVLDAAARQKAFTIAQVESFDTIAKVRDAIAESVREGVDIGTFRTRVLKAVDEGTFLSDMHMETVYRTCVQTAFSDGQMTVLSHPFVRSGFPYASYEAIHDDRVEETHLEMEKLGIQGTNIYRIDDPVFQRFRPPWRWCCRCSWIPMTVRMAASKGIAEAQEWLRTGQPPAQPAFVAMPPFSPPAGFERSLTGAPLSLAFSATAMSIEVPIVEAPDIRQMDDYSCGAASAMSAARTFGIGPKDLNEWKKALGTTRARSTLPERIVEHLQSLGLQVIGRDDMTIEDLQEEAELGNPVICPIQEYMIPSKKTSEKYGHYVVVVGTFDDYVIVQDPSIDNVLEGEGTEAAPGKMLIRSTDWLHNWHDKLGGTEYHRYGIVVSLPGRTKPVVDALPPEPTILEKTLTALLEQNRDVPDRFAAIEKTLVALTDYVAKPLSVKLDKNAITVKADVNVPTSAFKVEIDEIKVLETKREKREIEIVRDENGKTRIKEI